MQFCLSTAEPSARSMPSKFRCPYCQKVYSRESWFRKHDCEKRKRFEQVHNMDFIRGHHIYTHWRRRNGWLRRSKEPTAQEFIGSPFYTSFMNLVKFTQENWVISSMRYLDFLIDMRIAEAKWMHDETLRSYRDHIRRNDDPMEQIKTTYEAVKKWCEKNEIAPIQFFAKIGPGTALQMVTTNQISPWVLFGYDRSISDLLGRVNDDWMCSVNEFLNTNYWIGRLKASHDLRNAIQNESDRLFNQ